MVQTVNKGLWLWLVVGLSACTSSHRPALTQNAPVPMAAQAFGGGNLLSYDVYAEGDVLHALFAVAGSEPKRPHIGYVRSEDGGRSWSEPSALAQAADKTVESAAGNEIQIAAYGDDLLALWQVTGEVPGMGPLQSWYSRDGGKHWAQGANPTASDGDQSHPDVLADRQGRFHLVWLDDRDENGYQGLRYARTEDMGQHWDWAQTIDDSSCSCCWNRLLLGDKERIHALYRDMEPRDMALAQSENAGQSWQRLSTAGAFNWTFDGCPHNGGALASADGHTLHALVWTGADNQAGLYYVRSPDNGHNWTPPEAMGQGTLAFHSDLAVAADNGASRLLAIWDARGPEGSVVMSSESADEGVHWSAARQLSTPGRSAEFPRVIATSAGFLAFWFEQVPSGGKHWMSMILE